MSGIHDDLFWFYINTIKEPPVHRWFFSTSIFRPLLLIFPFPIAFLFSDFHYLRTMINVVAKNHSFLSRFLLPVSLKAGVVCTELRRVTGCLIFIGHFPQKSPRISGSFAERDVQLIRHPMHLRHPVHSRFKYVKIVSRMNKSYHI